MQRSTARALLVGFHLVVTGCSSGGPPTATSTATPTAGPQASEAPSAVASTSASGAPAPADPVPPQTADAVAAYLVDDACTGSVFATAEGASTAPDGAEMDSVDGATVISFTGPREVFEKWLDANAPSGRRFVVGFEIIVLRYGNQKPKTRWHAFCPAKDAVLRAADLTALQGLEGGGLRDFVVTFELKAASLPTLSTLPQDGRVVFAAGRDALALIQTGDLQKDHKGALHFLAKPEKIGGLPPVPWKTYER